MLLFLAYFPSSLSLSFYLDSPMNNRRVYLRLWRLRLVPVHNEIYRSYCAMLEYRSRLTVANADLVELFTVKTQNRESNKIYYFVDFSWTFTDYSFVSGCVYRMITIKEG